jgi:glycosyltransferase involved in cell wall biosynthesis
VGDGPQRQSYEGEARRTRHGARIRFLGRVDDATLQREYARCQLFVLPSGKEGFGLVFLEAMANGKAVIAAAAGAAPEVVSNEETGLIVPYGDVGAIAAAMSRLSRDGAWRRELGARGRRAVETSFSYAHYEREVHAELDFLRGL